jgi:two-component system sensor histidine kinase HydH
MDKHKYRIFLSGFSPWIILGAVLVLLPIVALMTLENINRQKQQSIRLMMEKGAALIRSFEAGTRMGMRGGHGTGFKLQRLTIRNRGPAGYRPLAGGRYRRHRGPRP